MDQNRDLNHVGGDQEVVANGCPAVVLQEDHQESESNEDHHVHVLEHGVVSRYIVLGKFLGRGRRVLDLRERADHELVAILLLLRPELLLHNDLIQVQALINRRHLKGIVGLTASHRSEIAHIFTNLLDAVIDVRPLEVSEVLLAVVGHVAGPLGEFVGPDVLTLGDLRLLKEVALRV